MTRRLKRILVIRNDKLGDFTLSLPVFMLLKEHLPDTEIHALVPSYTRPLAEACPYIDSIVLDPGPGAGIRGQLRLLRELRCNRYDAALTLFSTTRVGALLLAAGVRYRLAPATKLAQLFYNHRLKQRRSRSVKPEYCYNLDLGQHLLTDFGVTETSGPEGPYLEFDPGELEELHREFTREHNIPRDCELVFLHPGSGGSASNLSLEQYAQLARRLDLGDHRTLIVTAGPGEIDIALKLAAMIPDIPHRIYHSQAGLTRFAMHIALCTAFISGSTGPLHIAGALNRITVGFYPKRRSATPLRWQTLSNDGRRLAFSPPTSAEESDMSAIDLLAASKAINDLLNAERASRLAAS